MKKPSRSIWRRLLSLVKFAASKHPQKATNRTWQPAGNVRIRAQNRDGPTPWLASQTQQLRLAWYRQNAPACKPRPFTSSRSRSPYSGRAFSRRTSTSKTTKSTATSSTPSSSSRTSFSWCRDALSSSASNGCTIVWPTLIPIPRLTQKINLWRGKSASGGIHWLLWRKSRSSRRMKRCNSLFCSTVINKIPSWNRKEKSSWRKTREIFFSQI